jgi:ribosomal protein S18 acetylase RimI-like enzyme
MRMTDQPDPAMVAAALRALSRDMGDPYLMPDEVVARAMAAGIAGAVLAESAGAPVGVALYSLFLSTTRGRVGAFVTDLWVDAGQRGTGLGRRLLAGVRDRAAADWGATFLRLNYFADNPGAVAFYDRLGFRGTEGEVWVTLEGAELEGLR